MTLSLMSDTPLYILAPYVPTPSEVVSRMLQLANVGPEDVVFDLGCGDGRIVIAAALDCGAHGVGVDIEQYWIEQSRANAALAGVSHLTRFERQDAFSVDLASATVIFLYLVQWSTQRMFDHILPKVADGTRIVSHSFAIDAAATTPEPAESFVDSSGQKRSLYLYVTGLLPSAK